MMDLGRPLRFPKNDLGASRGSDGPHRSRGPRQAPANSQFDRAHVLQPTALAPRNRR